MKNIDNESDLKFEITFQDKAGNVLPFPDCDLSISYFVSYEKTVTASKIGEVFTNCHIDDEGKLILTFNKPRLGVGTLKRRFTYYIPDPDFTDFTREISELKIIGKIC